MRSTLLVIGTILVIVLTQFIDLPQNKKEVVKTKKYTIVIHGGAGTISKSLPDSVKKAYIESLTKALTIGKDILANGGRGLDAVEQVLRYFESDPKFNAGIGAVYTSAGTHEMDASIMNGKDLSAGAVAGVEHVKHPISLARLVMEKTSHVLLAYQGAEQFAEKMGIKLVPNSYFDTKLRYNQWQEYRKRLEEGKHGTVGCVVLDEYGNLAAGTSTGGMTNKMPGRIGDSPIIGAGTYADNNGSAVSGTGWGEKFIIHDVAFNMTALMKYKGYSLKKAANEIIHKILQPNDGGIIAVDKNGNYVMEFNTLGMFRGVATSSGKFEVKIWK